jgi:hypothetical protein
MTWLSTEFPWAFGPPEEMKILLVTPAQAGVHVLDEVDSRLRGNDVVGVIFGGAKNLPSWFILERRRFSTSLGVCDFFQFGRKAALITKELSALKWPKIEKSHRLSE